MTHSSCKTHGIRAKKQLTDDIGEPLILDMALSRFFCLEKQLVEAVVQVTTQEPNDCDNA